VFSFSLARAFPLKVEFQLFAASTATGEISIRQNSPRPKLSRAIEQLSQCEIIAQAGIALTPDVSFLVAQLARPVLQIENAKKFLALLPIETLATAL